MMNLAKNTAGLSRLAWTAGIIVGASLPHWTTLPVWITALLLVCVGWRIAVRLLRWPWIHPWILRPLTIIALACVIVQYGTINGLEPGSALLVVMLGLKFLEAKSQRDHMILTVIAYFLVFASLLAGGSLLRVLYLCAFVWITSVGLLQVGRQGPLLPGRDSARLAGRLLLHSLPFMLVLFVIFPRLSGPLWSLPAEGAGATSGLSGSMSPGDITSLGLSDEIAFRVDFLDRVPAASDLYWRGPILSEFDGRTWTAPEQSGMRGTGGRRSLSHDGLAHQYRVMLDADESGWLFALDMPEDWALDEGRLALRMNDDYQLLLWPRTATGSQLSYTVTSRPDYRAMETLGQAQRERFTRLPPDFNPRTRALIAQLSADSPDPRTLISRALGFFLDSEFYYTLTPPPLGRHTADEFLFETREGFCEHYASAFAIMMRMAGLPARVVTGYQGGELNPFGDYYIVRQSNAHAWTEVWTEADGWIRVDPVATVSPERVSLGLGDRTARPAPTFTQRLGNSTLLRQLALTWDAVDTFWDRWIVGYGPRLQRDLLSRLGLEQVRREDLFVLAVFATIALMAGLGFWFSRSMRRWHRAADPAAQALLRFSRKLERLDVAPQRQGETPSAWARRAAGQVPDAAGTIDAVTSAYLAARYEPDPDGAALRRLGELVQRFRPHYGRGSR